MFTDKYNPDDYSNSFRIRHLVFSPKQGSDESKTLQELLKEKKNSAHLDGVVVEGDDFKITIKGYEDKSDYILLAFAECDHLAKVSVTPSDISTPGGDTHSVNNLDSYQVFMLVDGNKVFANIQISTRKVNSVINQFLRNINVLGSTRESLNIESVDLIRSEGLRGIEVEGFFSSEDSLKTTESKPNKIVEFFKDLFDAPPPVLDSPIVGKFSLNINDNLSQIVDESLIETPELLVEYLGSGLILVTGKGKKISGQSFVQEETFYLRPYTKNSVSLSAAFATLSYYKENM